MLEIFADEIKLNLRSDILSEHGAEIFLKSLWHLALNSASLSLIADGDVSVLSKVQAAIDATPQLASARLRSLRDIVEAGFPVAIHRLLHW